MDYKRIGQTVTFKNPPSIIAAAAIAGRKESDGPLGQDFDMTAEDDYFDKESWEMAEANLHFKTAEMALKKASKSEKNIDFVISGDLQNQCAASHYSIRNLSAPFLGVYGACSTMTESLALSAMLIDGGFAKNILCGTSSHFCSAEKQFRFPLEYGGIRTPTSQWTVTGSGFCVLSNTKSPITVTQATIGKIVDMGITDINNMGAAMAPAACDTLISHFRDTNKTPADYDLILTGDLGVIGSDLLRDMLNEEGYDIYPNHNDCGMMIYDIKNQDAHAGGSGCGCCASVFCSHIYKKLQKGELKNIAVMATGALMNPQVVLQGESIPTVAHLVVIKSNSKEEVLGKDF